MVETIEQIGDLLGTVWALFEQESGELTVLALTLLAGLALLTAFRCFQALRPAIDADLKSVVAAGSAITLVFVGVGAFFLIRLGALIF